MDNFIKLQNVSFEYSGTEGTKTVIENLNLDIEKGSFTVILGHNGSGKSTLAKLLNGLYKPDKGDVFVDGINTKDTDREIEIKRRVGLVFQNPDNQLLASVVEDDVAFGPENLGCPPEESKRRVADALNAVGMIDYINSAPHLLSGGQKQRVAIAGIIAMLPECIVFDEPTSMLDPKGRAEIISTIERLNKQNGITVILITHFMEEAANADRVIVLNDGEIIADDIPKVVFKNADLLKNIGLDVPITTDLMLQLKNKGFRIDTDIISIEEAAKSIINALHSEGK